MRRTAAVLLLFFGVILGFGGAGGPTISAGPDQKNPCAPSKLPAFKEGAVHLSGDLTDVRLSELLLVVCDQTGISVIYDSRVIPLQNHAVTITNSQAGRDYTVTEFEQLLADTFDAQGLGFVSTSSSNTYRLVGLNDSAFNPRKVDREELPVVSPLECVSVVYRPRYVTSNELAGALRVMMRSPGYVSPTRGAVILCGRATALQHLLPICDAADQPSPDEPVGMRYNIPPTFKAAEVISMLSTLFPAKDGVSPVSVVALPNNAIVVRATAVNQDTVKTLIDSLGK